MLAVVQRVSAASVSVDGAVVGAIDTGLCVLLAIETDDTPRERGWMADKLAALRIFPDDAGRMNRPVTEASGAVLLVPNFTVVGDARKGNRPAFTRAMKPLEAEREYHAVAEALRHRGLRVETGRFGAHMEVRIDNDGPVTIILESP